MKQLLLLTVVTCILCTCTLTISMQRYDRMSAGYTPLDLEVEVVEIPQEVINAAKAKCKARREAKKQNAMLLLLQQQQKAQKETLQTNNDILDQ